MPYGVVSDDAPTVIAGFYTLSALSVRLESLRPDIVKRFPRYPNVPATLIGRLAVDRAFRRRGLGEHLLLDALQRSLKVSRTIGSAAVVVDAKDADARPFYGRYGCVPFTDQPMRLLLPMKTIQRLFPGPDRCRRMTDSGQRFAASDDPPTMIAIQSDGPEVWSPKSEAGMSHWVNIPPPPPSLCR